MRFITLFVTLLLSTAFSGIAMATQCNPGSGKVALLGNDFPALQAVASKAMECANDKVQVTANLTSSYKNLHVSALSAKNSGYSVVLVGNSSIIPLLNEDLVRPLDDYVQQWGQSLDDKQLITVNGKTVAIALLANAQHLFYRDDILEQAGVTVPASYTGILEAAREIREQKLLQYPIAASYQAGWNLALEFINLYLATGAKLFETGSAQPAINNSQAIATLHMMKALSEFMSPDFLTHDPNAVQAEWEAGNTALALQWGSRAAAVLEAKEANRTVVDTTRFDGAPVFIPAGLSASDKPAGSAAQASTLWWVGFSIARNLSDEDAEASFKTMIYASNSATIRQHNDKAVWLGEGYEPGIAAAGIYSVINSGAPSYPSAPYLGLLHTALGVELVDFLNGTESAQQALNDVIAAYLDAAIAEGFVK